jgi:hypothetical protein
LRPSCEARIDIAWIPRAKDAKNTKIRPAKIPLIPKPRLATRISEILNIVMLRRVLLLSGLLATVAFGLVEPEEEFLSGETATFSSSDRPKARGVELSIQYPRSWRASEGASPAVIQKFVSEAGRGAEQYSISVNGMPVPPSDEDLDYQYSAQGLRDVIPPEATVVQTDRIVFHGRPAGHFIYIQPIATGNVRRLFRLESYMFYYRGNLVVISNQMSVLDGENAESNLRAREIKYAALFRLIMESIVLRD